MRWDGINTRFDRIRQCIQPILNLVRLFTNGIQRTGIARGIVATWSRKGMLAAEVVACRAPDLRHCVECIPPEGSTAVRVERKMSVST